MANNNPDHVIETDADSGCPSLLLLKSVFGSTAILKTLRLFSDHNMTSMHPDGEDYVRIVFLEHNKSSCVPSDILMRFYNAVMDQQIREDIQTKCKDIQNQIYQAAFAPLFSRGENS